MSGTEPGPHPADPLRRLSDELTERLVRPRVYGRHQWRIWWGVAVVVALLPLVIAGGYQFNIAVNAELFAILSLGFYFQFALAGQFSFATPAYYAVGAYTFAWAAPSGGFLLAFGAAVVVTAALGALTKLLLARSPLIHFAIATLAFGSLVLIVLQNWTSFSGGGQGTFGIPQPSIFGYLFDTGTKQYYLCGTVTLLGVALLILFERSPAQRDLVFVRDMGAVAQTAGLRSAHVQVVAFGAGASFMGAAGALLASTAGFVDLSSFSTANGVSIALLVLLMVLLGGVGSVWGPVIGAALLTVLPQVLARWKSYEELIYSVIILVVILVLPGGITSLLTELRTRRTRRRPGRAPAP